MAANLGAVHGADVRTRAGAHIRSFVEFSARRPELSRLMLQEGKVGGERMAWVVDRYARPHYEILLGLLRELQDEGIALGFEPEQFYFLLIGAGATIFAAAPECRRLSGKDPSSPAMVEAQVRVVVDLLLGRSTESGRRDPEMG